VFETLLHESSFSTDFLSGNCCWERSQLTQTIGKSILDGRSGLIAIANDYSKVRAGSKIAGRLRKPWPSCGFSSMPNSTSNSNLRYKKHYGWIKNVFQLNFELLNPGLSVRDVYIILLVKWMVQSELHGHRRIHARYHFLEWDGSFLVGQRIGRNHQQAFRDCLFRADSKLPQIFIKWTEYQQTLQVCLLLRDENLLFGHRSFFSWQQIRKKGKFIYSWYDISQKMLFSETTPNLLNIHLHFHCPSLKKAIGKRLPLSVLKRELMFMVSISSML